MVEVGPRAGECMDEASPGALMKECSIGGRQTHVLNITQELNLYRIGRWLAPSDNDERSMSRNGRDSRSREFIGQLEVMGMTLNRQTLPTSLRRLFRRTQGRAATKPSAPTYHYR
ncbi:hypothetical protein EVAR_40969_1 [Eumeta japonica]|uniref:Uncharacterized protein n=1 Tax=Eumeta variegata TaxID=151549 RepID=A0A4C1X7R7_EUMVA|nr:hypothetical protein EVAR_40969_1 [Eumeta japonica]